MKDNRYYYDEQIKNYFFEDYYKEFTKVKDKSEKLTLDEVFRLQTKGELIEIAKRTEIKGYSKLGKEELVKYIKEGILKKLEEVLFNLSLKEVNLLKEILKDEEYEYIFKVEDLATIGALTSLGIVHKVNKEGKYILVIPEEFMKPINKLIEDEEVLSIINSKAKGINYIDGLMNHYGMLLGGDLYKIIIDNKNNLFPKEDLNYYLDYIFRSYEAFTDANALIHPLVFSPEDIWREVELRHTIKYDFNKIEYFLNMGKEENNLFINDINVLKEILIEKGMEEDHLLETINLLRYYIKNDFGTISIVQLLEEKGLSIHKEEDEDLVSSLVNIYKNTPMWILKGLTPTELEERRRITVIKEKEPGRNDPCPCNSGKKYKKCCGK